MSGAGIPLYGEARRQGTGEKNVYDTNAVGMAGG